MIGRRRPGGAPFSIAKSTIFVPGWYKTMHFLYKTYTWATQPPQGCPLEHTKPCISRTKRTLGPHRPPQGVPWSIQNHAYPVQNVHLDYIGPLRVSPGAYKTMHFLYKTHTLVTQAPHRVSKIVGFPHYFHTWTVQNHAFPWKTCTLLAQGSLRCPNSLENQHFAAIWLPYGVKIHWGSSLFSHLDGPWPCKSDGNEHFGYMPPPGVDFACLTSSMLPYETSTLVA